jgi:CDP-paratose synthetase
MRILLTGVTGYLGSHLAQAWLAADVQVRGLKRTTSSTARIDHLPQLQLFDIEGADLAALMDGVDVVVHTAASYGRAGETAVQVAEANLAMPLTLLEAAKTAGVKAFISTDTVLDRMMNPYALSKAQFAEWGRLHAADGKLAFVNIRLQHFYGAGDASSKFTTHVIRNCLANVPELALTAGGQLRDFIHIDDVVAGYQQLVAYAVGGPHGYRDIDLGSGAAVSVRQLVETIHALSGSRTALQFGALPYRPGEAMFAQANTETMRALGWSCRTSLEDGLRRTIASEAGQR